MTALTQSEANNYLNNLLKNATYTAPTSPTKLALCSTTGTDTTAGTEISGGSYARADIHTAMATSTAKSSSNSSAVTFSNLLASGSATINGIDIYDSAGTPARLMFGSLTVPRAINAGDSITFATGQLVVTAV